MSKRGKLVLLTNDETEWLLVGEVFEKRVEEVIEDNPGIKPTKLRELLEEKNIPYTYLTSNGRDVKVEQFNVGN